MGPAQRPAVHDGLDSAAPQGSWSLDSHSRVYRVPFAGKRRNVNLSVATRARTKLRELGQGPLDGTNVVPGGMSRLELYEGHRARLRSLYCYRANRRRAMDFILHRGSLSARGFGPGATT
jgi:hypothetical protein